MTQAIVVRMSRKEVADLDALARARFTNRSALLRQAARNFVAANKGKKGVGWPEKLAELRRLSRASGHKPVDRDIVGELRALDRDGALPS